MSEEKCEACSAGYGIELDRCHGYTHANAIIKLVRGIHKKMTHIYGKVACTECGQAWPCNTIKALDGE